MVSLMIFVVVSGAMVSILMMSTELFRGGATRTERAYPTSTSRWHVDADPAMVEGWALALP